jgi:hypothetical protein
MKRIIVTGAVAAIAAVSFAGTASAAPVPGTPQCFGQVHKAVNSGFLSAAGINNVGQLVQSDLAAANGFKGQGKNAVANTVCPS